MEIFYQDHAHFLPLRLDELNFAQFRPTHNFLLGFPSRLEFLLFIIHMVICYFIILVTSKVAEEQRNPH